MTAQFIVADVFAGLAALEADSIDCVVTSPPYWRLRDYGTGVWQGGEADCDHRSPTMRSGRNEARPMLSSSVASNSAQLRRAHSAACGACGAVLVDRQFGLERTLPEHIDVLTQVFREVRRVLKPEGTFWLNYGDSYAATPNGSTHLTHDGRYRSKRDDRTHTDKPFSTVGGPPKFKDLSLASARLAISLCDAGWWLRADNIWVKPNPKPESIKDRPSNAHEHVFLLTKSPRYFYGASAVKEPAQGRRRSSWKDRRASEPPRQGDPLRSRYVNSTQTLASGEDRNLRNDPDRGLYCRRRIVSEHGAIGTNCCRVLCPCELCRIFASALRACPHPYPQTAQGRAAYWDGLIL